MDRRCFLSGAAALPVGMSSFLASLHAASRPEKQADSYGDWHQEKLLCFMIGSHTPDVDQSPELVALLGNGDAETARKRIWEKITPASLVDLVEEMGAEAFYFYAKCFWGNAYYPSRVGHVHSMLRGRDFFGEVVEHCRKKRIVPIGIYECEDRRIAAEKPEWRSRGENGRPAELCFQSPYGDFMLAQAEEILRQYDIASVFFDMVDYHGRSTWSCPYCDKIYRNEFGRSFRGTSQMTHEERAEYRDWCQRQVASYLRKLKDLRDQIAPDCGLEHNFHGLVGSHFSHNWKDTKNLTANFFADTFAFRDGSVVDAYYPKVYRNTGAAERPLLLLDSSYAGMVDTHDPLTPKPFDFYLTQAASALANQVAVCTSICIQVDGTMDPTTARTIRKTNEHFRPRIPLFLGARPVQYAGIVFPGRSRDIAPDDEAWRYPMEFTGWVRLLAEHRILYDVIADELLDADSLAPYKLLVLPNLEALSDAQVKAIEAFVRNQGTIVVTGNTSLRDWTGRDRGEFGLRDTLGVSLIEPLKKEKGYLHLTAKPALDDDPTVSPWIAVPDGLAVIQALSGTEVLARRALRPGNHTWRYETDQPALTGRGSVYYFAAEPGLAYCRYQYPAIHRLVGRILSECREELPVKVKCEFSVQVEASVQESPRCLMVHLINRTGNSAWTAAAQRVGSRMFTTGQPHRLPPVCDIEVRVKRSCCQDVQRVFLGSSGKEIGSRDAGSDVAIRVERLDVDETLVIE